MKVTYINNFNLIRLFASLQVTITHIFHYFNIDSFLLKILTLFPGVPIFLFISGFLVFESYKKSITGPKPYFNFFAKRFLRIFPPLVFCVFLSLISVFQSGYFNNLNIEFFSIIRWIFSQLTILQFYNPEFFRNYGVGVINGSLWTISVEIQLYLLTPIIYLIIKKNNIIMILLILIILLFLNILNIYNPFDTIYHKLYFVSFLPWALIFFFGILANKYFSLFQNLRKVPLLFFLLIYVIFYFFTKDLGWGNQINFFSLILLIFLIIKIAYSLPHLSNLILKKIDISYGIYILHMPVVNYLIYKNISGYSGAVLALLATIILSLFLWFFLEKKILNLKNKL